MKGRQSNQSQRHMKKRNKVDLLMESYARHLQRLASAGIHGNIVGDYGEHLATRALSLARATPSQKAYDATAKNGDRYQIKSIRMHKTLGVIRYLDEKRRGFDFLVAVIFTKDFRVDTALKMPYRTVKRFATYYKKIENGHILTITEKLREGRDVEDITDKLELTRQGEE